MGKTVGLVRMQAVVPSLVSVSIGAEMTRTVGRGRRMKNFMASLVEIFVGFGLCVICGEVGEDDTNEVDLMILEHRQTHHGKNHGLR